MIYKPIFNNFTGGEVSDRVAGRIDSPDFLRSCRKLENMIIHPSGGVDRTPGTYFICEAKTNTGTVRLIPFEKSSTEKYVLELSDQACRFYKNKAQLLDGANPLEIVTPWAATHLFGLQTAQKENKLYLAHGNYQIHRMTNYADLIWNLANADIDVSLAVAHYTTPFVTAYSYINDVFTKRPNPDVLPAGDGYGCALSLDGMYLAVTHSTTPYITIYKRSGDTFTKLANPATLPTGAGRSCAFSLDGIYLAVGHETTPFITIYKRNGDTFTKLADPATLPTGAVWGCAFSPNGTYLAVGYAVTPFFSIYKRSGDTFTKLTNPATMPTGPGYIPTFSSDSLYLVASHDISPFITIYKRSGDTFTKLANPATLPGGNAHSCVFSSNDVYLAVGHETTPFITIYKRNGDTFTKLADPATLPPATSTGCAFSPDGVYLAVPHIGTPYITIYKRSGDTFTKLTNPVTLPTGTGQGCTFALDAWQGISWGSKYPKALSFHDQRLLLGRDQIVRGSRISWPQDFILDAADSSAGFEYSLASDILEEIVWLKTKAHNIVIGTTSGEWLLTGGNAPITGSNVFADRVSGHGSYPFSAVLANESLLFLQTGGQRLREFMYSQERGGYISPDLTQWADHIGKTGFVDFAWQRSPRSLLWTLTSAGMLESLTLDRNSDIIAWSRHPQNGLIKSIAVVSGDEQNPEGIVYLCVQRTINGVTKQYIEYMKPLDWGDDQADCFFVNCGKTFDYTATNDSITGATQAKPVVIAAGTHPFVNDDRVRITGVVGMTELNDNVYCVKNKTADTFELYTADGVTQVDGTGYGTYISGGTAVKVVNSLSGLDHLKTEIVTLLVDGATHAQKTVSSDGIVTMDVWGSKIHVGLPYIPKIKLQRFPDLPTQYKRIHHATLRLFKSLGGKIGSDEDHLEPIPYPTGGPPPLYTGDAQDVPIRAGFGKDGDLIIVQQDPLPLSIMAIFADAESYEL